MIVITGVDGSESAGRAADTAASLATALGGRLVVVTAFSDALAGSPRDLADVVPMSSADVALSVAERTVEELGRSHPTLAMEPRSVIGKPADSLLSVADELDAGVIVVGNKRVQGFARLLGSIAQDVAQRASCDVYIAHTIAR